MRRRSPLQDPYHKAVFTNPDGSKRTETDSEFRDRSWSLLHPNQPAPWQQQQSQSTRTGLKEFQKQYQWDSVVKPQIEQNQKLQRELAAAHDYQRRYILAMNDLEDQWLVVPQGGTKYPTMDAAWAAYAESVKNRLTISHSGMLMIRNYLLANPLGEALYFSETYAAVVQRLIDLKMFDDSMITVHHVETTAPVRQPTLDERIEALPATDGRETSRDARALVEEGLLAEAGPIATKFFDYLAVHFEFHATPQQKKQIARLFPSMNLNPMRPDAWDKARIAGMRNGYLPDHLLATDEEIAYGLERWTEAHRAAGRGAPPVHAFERERQRRYAMVQSPILSFAEWFAKR